MNETPSKIVDDMLRNAVTGTLADMPDESVESQVRAAALLIMENCAEDLIRADAVASRKARPPEDAPIAQAFFDLLQVSESEPLRTVFGTTDGSFDLIEELTRRVQATRGLLS